MDSALTFLTFLHRHYASSLGLPRHPCNLSLVIALDPSNQLICRQGKNNTVVQSYHRRKLKPGSQDYVFHQLLTMDNTSLLTPQLAVTSGRNNNSEVRSHSVSSSNGYITSIFRLLLYCGDQDAFLPIANDNCHIANEDEYGNVSEFMTGNYHDGRHNGNS